MAAYYNDNEPFVAQWLRNLIAAGHIADGEVDERPIQQVRPDDLREFTQCHFFAGIGGWSLALRIAGWPDDRPVWTGSCPCQPFSVAGAQRGADDERHLWPAFFRLIRECRPGTVLGEQVAGAAGLAWLDHVCADLEGAGYAAAAADLPAACVGAPHIRQRLWWVAYSDRKGLPSSRPQQVRKNWKQGRGVPASSDWWSTEPDVGRLAHGVPSRVGRLRAYGNAIVPQVAAEFIGAVMGCMEY
jgi:DNA (cytosine-5)-methyltransferase 1